VKKQSSFKIAIFLGSNHERLSGLIHPVLWEGKGIDSTIKEQDERKRNDLALARGKEIALALDLQVEDCFVVRVLEDQRRVSRIVVCVVVKSLAPVGKKVTLLSRVLFPLQNTSEVRGSILDRIQPIVRGEGNIND
jgi:hypothetical protein